MIKREKKWKREGGGVDTSRMELAKYETIQMVTLWMSRGSNTYFWAKFAPLHHPNTRHETHSSPSRCPSKSFFLFHTFFPPSHCSNGFHVFFLSPSLEREACMPIICLSIGREFWKIRKERMLQRAASNAYSWWWASHIRTKQSKWLEQHLQGTFLLQLQLGVSMHFLQNTLYKLET